MQHQMRSGNRIRNNFSGFTFNVTTKVDWLIHDAWLKWMRDVHIPEVLGTGCFDGHSLVQILDTDESEGATYAVQYFTTSLSRYDTYIDEYAPTLKNEVLSKWGNKIISFRTLMGTVQ